MCDLPRPNLSPFSWRKGGKAQTSKTTKSLDEKLVQSCGANSCGHSTTANLPSTVRVISGAYSPRYSLRHQFPVRRLSSNEVNQYCQSTARTIFGADGPNGLPLKRSTTSASFSSSRSSVSGTSSF